MKHKAGRERVDRKAGDIIYSIRIIGQGFGDAEPCLFIKGESRGIVTGDMKDQAEEFCGFQVSYKFIDQQAAKSLAAQLPGDHNLVEAEAGWGNRGSEASAHRGIRGMAGKQHPACTRREDITGRDQGARLLGGGRETRQPVLAEGELHLMFIMGVFSAQGIQRIHGISAAKGSGEENLIILKICQSQSQQFGKKALFPFLRLRKCSNFHRILIPGDHSQGPYKLLGAAEGQIMAQDAFFRRKRVG